MREINVCARERELAGSGESWGPGGRGVMKGGQGRNILDHFCVRGKFSKAVGQFCSQCQLPGEPLSPRTRLGLGSC